MKVRKEKKNRLQYQGKKKYVNDLIMTKHEENEESSTTQHGEKIILKVLKEKKEENIDSRTNEKKYINDVINV